MAKKALLVSAALVAACAYGTTYSDPDPITFGGSGAGVGSSDVFYFNAGSGGKEVTFDAACSGSALYFYNGNEAPVVFKATDASYGFRASSEILVARYSDNGSWLLERGIYGNKSVDLKVGYNCGAVRYGDVFINGSASLIVNTLSAGYKDGSYGLVIVDGGEISASYITLGEEARGYLILSNGMVNVSAICRIGQKGNTNSQWGRFDVEGKDANVTFAMLYVGYQGNGTLNISNGTVTVNNAVKMGYQTSGVATINLAGGTLTIPGIAAYTGGRNLNFDGGTLKASGNNPAFVTNTIACTIKEGGAIIDTQSYDVTILSEMTHGGASATDGGLVKKGAGTLTLSTVPTFTGTITVEEGAVVLPDTFDIAGRVGRNTQVADSDIASTIKLVHSDSVIKVEFSNDDEIIIDNAWISAHMAGAEAMSNDEIAAAMAVDAEAKPEGSKYNYFACYALGLLGGDKPASPVLELVPDGAGFKARVHGIGTVPDGVRLVISLRTYADGECTEPIDETENITGAIVKTGNDLVIDDLVVMPSGRVVVFYRAEIEMLKAE